MPPVHLASVAQAIARPRQEWISLAIAGAIVAAWLGIHIFGIFFWRAGRHGWISAAVLVPLQAWLSTGLFIIAHDAMHGALAPARPRLNRAVGSVCLMLYACISYGALLPNHHAHHRHAGTEGDPDFHPGNPRALLPWFARFVATYYSSRQFLLITLVASVYVFLLGATYACILLFWALPALLALGQLFLFGTYLPHRHAADAFADSHNARSSKLAPALSLLTCFHFGGYHHEHHLSPGTAWWHLPAFRRSRASYRS